MVPDAVPFAEIQGRREIVAAEIVGGIEDAVQVLVALRIDEPVPFAEVPCIWNVIATEIAALALRVMGIADAEARVHIEPRHR